MSINVVRDSEKKKLDISVKDRFDYSMHDDFRAIYRDVHDLDYAVTINLTEATYIDSAAMAMLLLLRQHFGGDDARINIITNDDTIRKLLEIVNFDELFPISG